VRILKVSISRTIKIHRFTFLIWFTMLTIAISVSAADSLRSVAPSMDIIKQIVALANHVGQAAIVAFPILRAMIRISHNLQARFWAV